MIIKTITCHDVYNYGASLQAYALQTYLGSLGHDVEIIDYKPEYLSKHYKLLHVANSAYDRPLVKQLYLLAKLPRRLISLRRKWKFDEFTKNYLRTTPQCYHNNEELKSNPPRADVYIAGSDQIWNTLFENGRDAAFYLDFAPPKTKKISYAASFATKDVVEEYKPFVRKMLKNFDCISLRESVSLPLLESLGRNDGMAVCDPVFLLTKTQWKQLIPNTQVREKYLLVYDTEGSENLKTIAKSIAKEKQLIIYDISGSPRGYAKKNMWASSPIDFLWYIRDAEFIVSNSFHATAFSLIMEKNFCVVNRTEGINERMKSILSAYGMEERLTSSFMPFLLNNINYQDVIPLLEKDVDYSKKFLQESIM